ncbi:MAG: inorganic pyrophosphatase [Myxococcaceae bacterium]
MPSDRLSELLALMFQAHPWHGVPSSPGGGVFNVYVELVPADTVKYELDKPNGHLRLDRAQRFSSLCPTLYGFIPQSYCGRTVAERCAERTGHAGIEGDGDPMDVCVMAESAGAHGFFAQVRPIGGLRLIDGDQADDKIIAVLESDVAYGHLWDIGECPRPVIERIEHYFLAYKQMPGSPVRRVKIAEIYDRAEALEVIRRSIDDYRETFGPPEERLEEFRRLLARGRYTVERSGATARSLSALARVAAALAANAASTFLPTDGSSPRRSKARRSLRSFMPGRSRRRLSQKDKPTAAPTSSASAPPTTMKPARCRLTCRRQSTSSCPRRSISLTIPLRSSRIAWTSRSSCSGRFSRI